jgi:hypothetical protein
MAELYQSQGLLTGPCLANDLEIGFILQQGNQALTHNGMIIDDK